MVAGARVSRLNCPARCNVCVSPPCDATGDGGVRCPGDNDVGGCCHGDGDGLQHHGDGSDGCHGSL